MGKVRQRVSAPQRQGVTQLRGGPLGIAGAEGGAALLGQAPEAVEVELVGIEMKHVTRQARHQDISRGSWLAFGLEQPAKLGDENL